MVYPKPEKKTLKTPSDSPECLEIPIFPHLPGEGC